jgi:putative cell wall-binding protein
MDSDATLVGGRTTDTPHTHPTSKHEAEFMNRSNRTTLAVVAACLAFAVLPASALSIPRDLVLTRGKVWVNYQRIDAKTKKKVKGVPYSQSRWAYENGKMVPTSTPSPSTTGYRTDCSGFASLCWSLRDSKGKPYSASTSVFGAKGSKKYFQITKTMLRPGDMMLKSTVWGAPTGHAIIFAGWVDSTKKKYWALEQTKSKAHDGTILHPRDFGEAYYRPYRYSGIEDPYSDCQESVSASDAYHAASDAAQSSFPTATTTSVPSLVLASAAQPGDQIVAASLARAVSGPALLASPKWLPSTTYDEIKRLKPKRVFVLGSTAVVSKAVSDKIASMGCTVVRINSRNRFQTSALSIERTVSEAAASKRPVDTAYLVNGTGLADALSAAPVLGKTGRPLLFVDKDSMPAYTTKALKKSGIKKLVLLGSAGAISAKQEKALKKAGYSVSRIAGANAYRTSVAIASHAISLKVGFAWKSAGLVSRTSYTDALAWASASGLSNQVYLLTASNALDRGVRDTVITQRKTIGKIRVYGNNGAISTGVRDRLATAMRSGK